MIGRVTSLIKMQEPACDDLLFASGATVPTAGATGYETSCIFQHTDGAAGTALYINEGTAESCDFQAVAGLTAAQEAQIAANVALLAATAGTVTALKAVIVDANKDAGTFRNVLAASFVEAQDAPAAIADGDTAITAANLQSKILTMASTTAGRAPTVPTGTAVAAVVAVGNCIDWYFLNTGNQTVTITAAADHTLVGTMELLTLTQGHFRTRVSAANTAITYRIA